MYTRDIYMGCLHGVSRWWAARRSVVPVPAAPSRPIPRPARMGRASSVGFRGAARPGTLGALPYAPSAPFPVFPVSVPEE
ncbi:hypothetical protein SNOUR_25725 [Streptomyces noursei ATCC 11455]|nr:hypothetical protein SNOUR_25725 [Streptomyces noursei ATCC 11455]